MAQEVALRDLHRVVGVCFVYRFYAGSFRYLVLKRHPNAKVYPGFWTIPGGGMERMDYESQSYTSKDGWEQPLESALRREVREEVGVEVGPFRFLSTFAFIRPDDVPVFGVRYAAPYQFGTVTIDPNDATGFTWITASESEQYTFLGHIPSELKRLDRLLLTERKKGR